MKMTKLKALTMKLNLIKIKYNFNLKLSSPATAPV